MKHSRERWSKTHNDDVVRCLKSNMKPDVKAKVHQIPKTPPYCEILNCLSLFNTKSRFTSLRPTCDFGRLSISDLLGLNHYNRQTIHAQLARTTMAPAGKRIVFTGGSGKAGRHVIPELLKRGHQVGVGLGTWPVRSTQC
jgi:hypothetical protein